VHLTAADAVRIPNVDVGDIAKTCSWRLLASALAPGGMQIPFGVHTGTNVSALFITIRVLHSHDVMKSV
jgi:hypothetical protein